MRHIWLGFDGICAFTIVMGIFVLLRVQELVIVVLWKCFLCINFVCTPRIHARALSTDFTLVDRPWLQVYMTNSTTGYERNLDNILNLFHTILDSTYIFWCKSSTFYSAEHQRRMIRPLVCSPARLLSFRLPTVARCIDFWRVFGSTTRVTRVSLTDMRNINNPALQAERLVLLSDKSNLFYQGTLLFVRATSDVSSFLLTATSNENRELSHTTPEAATRTPEAATLATLVLPINWRVTRVV